MVEESSHQILGVEYDEKDTESWDFSGFNFYQDKEIASRDPEISSFRIPPKS
jgi:hypothetical protein